MPLTFGRKYKIVEEKLHTIVLPVEPSEEATYSYAHDMFKKQKEEGKRTKEVTLYRIMALFDIPLHGVKKGDLGGWISHKGILSHTGSSWIANEAKAINIEGVNKLLRIEGNALVKDNALVIVSNLYSLRLSGNAVVSSNARINISDCSTHDTYSDRNFIDGDARISGNALILRNCQITGEVAENAVAIGCQISGTVFGDAELIECKVLDEASVCDKADAIYATISGRAQVSGKTSIGVDTVISDNAFIKGGRVYGSCIIKDSAIINEDAIIGEGTIISGTSTIGRGAKIKASEKIDNQTVLATEESEQKVIPPKLKVDIPKDVMDSISSNGTKSPQRVLMDALSKEMTDHIKNAPVKVSSQKKAGTPVAILPQEETDVSLCTKKLANIKDAIHSYESDIAKILMYPTFTDNTDEKTLEMRIALNDVDNISAVQSPERFVKAVRELERKFMIAEAHARRVASSGYTEEQRRQAETAKNLIALVLDDASSETEKKGAFKQAFRKLEGVVAVPEVAVETLRQKSGLLELESS